MRALFLLLFPSVAFGQIRLDAPTTFYRAAPPPKPELAPATYKISWDPHFSPYSGGEDLLFGTRLAESIEMWIFGKSPIITSKTMYARTWRLSELTMFWMPVNYLAVVAQHEVFGHGYRIRDINHGRVKVTGYFINTPPPYGEGGGATSYVMNDDLTTTQDACIAMAGVESTAILAELTKFKWLEAGRIDPRQTILYLLSQHDLNLYIGTLKTKGELDGHDIHGYIKSVNYTYPENLLSGARLRSLSWINLADPFTFYAIYAWFHYLSSGKETKIPMIASCYLPGLRLGLTPFGPEVFIENYFAFKKRPFYGYLKGGHHAKNQYYGLGFYAPSIWRIQRWSFGGRIDLWRQPKLLLNPASTPIDKIDFDAKPNPSDPLYPASQQHAVRYGGAASLIIYFHGTERIGCEIEGGYKAQGFLPGYSLRAFPTIRLALGLLF